LAEWYKTDLKNKGLDVVFVSSDRDENAFKEYFAEQPWHALEYSDRQAKNDLSKALGINGIPSLVILDKDGSVINKDGQSAVAGDSKGDRFPWYPKPVHDMKDGPGNINEIPTLLAFCETSSTETKQAVEAAMEPISGRFLAAAKAKEEEEPDIAFSIVTEASGIAPRIRSLLGMSSLTEEPQAPRLMLLDIPDEGGFYEGPEGDITEEVLAKFVADYQAKTLTRKQMQS
jgi:nucleoredoxin